MSTKHAGKRNLESIPVGSLGLITLPGCRTLGERVDRYLVRWRTERENEHKDSLAFAGYQRPSYLIKASTPRFGTGEAKGVIEESVRGMDLYILVDISNYSLTYSLGGQTNHMSPDDHYQDLKRIIAAVGGKARRINVIMPLLYESRQHRRNGRESLDCALALQELVAMGVDNIITFDAHDPRVQNAIPLHGFETVQASYQFIKAMLGHVDDLEIDTSHMMIISPDEGGMSRAIYIANVLGLDVGMFYKRRDYTQVVDGRNPIMSHEFLGTDVTGKDVVIIDDMIASGESLLEVASELHARGAHRVFAFATFGLFTKGLARIDEACASGLIENIFTTNLIYQTPDLLSRNWYVNCDMSKYIAFIIDTLNHDSSISDLLDPNDRIQSVLAEYRSQGRHALQLELDL